MKSFLKKLDLFIEIMDNELQGPIVRSMTGEVFTHDATAHHSHQEQVTRPVAVTPSPARDTRPVDKNVVCPPRLRPATAHKK